MTRLAVQKREGCSPTPAAHDAPAPRGRRPDLRGMPLALQLKALQPDGTPSRQDASEAPQPQPTPEDGTQPLEPQSREKVPTPREAPKKETPPRERARPRPAPMAPPNLRAPLGVLMVDLETRMATDPVRQDLHIRQMFCEIINRMHVKLGNELNTANGASAAGRRALKTMTIASSADEVHRRVQIQCQLASVASHIRIAQTHTVYMGKRAGSLAGIRTVWGWVRRFHGDKYAKLVLAKPVSSIVDQKATIGQFGRGQDRIVEQTLHELRGTLRTIAKPLFVAALKRAKVNEHLAGLAFDISWDFLDEVIGNHLILKGQVNWKQVSDKLMGKFVMHLVAALLGLVTQKLGDNIKGQLDGTEVAKAVTGFCVELGLEVPAKTLELVTEQIVAGKSPVEAFKTVFSPGEVRKNMNSFLTEKNYTTILGVKTG